jgi:hypothetical protein
MSLDPNFSRHYNDVINLRQNYINRLPYDPSKESKLALLENVNKIKKSSEFKKYKESNKGKSVTEEIISKLNKILHKKSFFSKSTNEKKYPIKAETLKRNIMDILDCYLIINFEEKKANKQLNKISSNTQKNIKDSYKTINEQITTANEYIISYIIKSLNNSNLLSNEKEINSFLNMTEIENSIIAKCARKAVESCQKIEKIVTEVHKNKIDRQFNTNKELLEYEMINKPSDILIQAKITIHNKLKDLSDIEYKKLAMKSVNIKATTGKIVKQFELIIAKLDTLKKVLKYYNKHFYDFNEEEQNKISNGIFELNSIYKYIDSLLRGINNSVEDKEYLFAAAPHKVEISRDRFIDAQAKLIEKLEKNINVLPFYDEKMSENAIKKVNINHVNDNEEKIDNSIKKLQSLSINVVGIKENESVIDKKITKIKNNIKNNLDDVRDTSDGLKNQDKLIKKPNTSSLKFEAGIDDEDYTKDNFLDDLEFEYFGIWRECHKNAANASKVGDKKESLKLLNDLDAEMDKFEKFMVSGDVEEAGNFASKSHEAREKAAKDLLTRSKQL